jgi:hypothetical protein
LQLDGRRELAGRHMCAITFLNVPQLDENLRQASGLAPQSSAANWPALISVA